MSSFSIEYLIHTIVNSGLAQHIGPLLLPRQLWNLYITETKQATDGSLRMDAFSCSTVTDSDARTFLKLFTAVNKADLVLAGTND